MLPTIALITVFACFGAATIDFESERSALEASLLPRLTEMAVEANRMKAYATRDRCYRAILVIEPDNFAARRGLKYKRVGGEWVHSPRRNPVKDSKSKRVEGIVADTGREIADYSEAVLELIEAHRQKLGGEGERLALERLVQFDPDSADLHARIGETDLDGHWVLIETARSIERKADLRAIAQKSFESVPVKFSAESNNFENEVGLPWTKGFQSNRVRVFGTGDPDEVEQVFRASHAMGDLFIKAFETDIDLPSNYAVYVLANIGEQEILLNRLPGGRQDRFEDLSLVMGGWLGLENKFGNWSADRPRRVDGATRATVSQYLLRNFRVDLKHGWASEGFGVYLVEAMVGTRLTWFTKKDRYIVQRDSSAVEKFSLQNEKLEWMDLGREMLLAQGAPHLGALIGRPVSAMNSRDLVFAYVLATYLIEGRPEETPKLLKAIGKGGNPTRTFEAILGETLPRIEERLKRWLVELAEYEGRRSQ